jgi:hypothetical protein
MMTLISFFGGTAFRLIFGGVMDYLNKRQEHTQEMALIKVQADLDAQRHLRDQESIRLQAELGIKQVVVQADAREREQENEAFLAAVKNTGLKTGIHWVDAWNGSIRPAGASIALAAWVATMMAAGFVFTDFDRELIAAFLGVFVGERIHNRLAR